MSSSGQSGPPSASEKQGPIAFVATQSLFVAIATFLVLTRVYVRLVIVKSFGLDDAVIVLAMVSIFSTKLDRKLTNARFSLSSRAL